MQQLQQQIVDSTRLYDETTDALDQSLSDFITPRQLQLEASYEQISSGFLEDWQARFDVVNDAFAVKTEKIEEEYSGLQFRVQSLRNELIVPQLTQTLAQSYNIAKQNCNLLEQFYTRNFETDAFDELNGMLDDQ